MHVLSLFSVEGENFLRGGGGGGGNVLFGLNAPRKILFFSKKAKKTYYFAQPRWDLLSFNTDGHVSNYFNIS